MHLARAEELPIRLAHRVKELDQLPHNLSHMPSIKKVKDWYAQSFEVQHILSPGLRYTHTTNASGTGQFPANQPPATSP